MKTCPICGKSFDHLEGYMTHPSATKSGKLEFTCSAECAKKVQK